MSLNVPTLDDRTYVDLVREGIELIPASAPGWTNHNASDPGITLVELFAYLAEIYLYRVDRVSAATKAKFLKLLTGIDHPTADDRQLHDAVVAMRMPSRAVSEVDFEDLAMNIVEHEGHSAKVARVRCCARRNFEAVSAAERHRDRPGHVTVVFVPTESRLPDAELTAIARVIKAYLEPRRLITARVHVVPPRYVDVGVRIHTALASSRAAALERKIRNDIEGHYRSWPLGGSLFTADLYRRLSSIDGVRRVSAIEWTRVDSARLLRSEGDEVVGVRLEEDELPRVSVNDVVSDVYS